MASITKEELDILIKLQAVETESVKIRKILDGVDNEINLRKKKLLTAEKEFGVNDSELDELKSIYKTFEDEVQERDNRLKKSEEYLKIVTTNHEYQTLLREIDDNKKKNSEVESLMIESLQNIEVKEKEVLEKKSAFDEISRQVEVEIAEIEKSTVNEKKELSIIHQKRDEIAKQLPARLLSRFNKMLEQSAGLAIVPATNGTCGGCFMNVPPQKFIEIQRGDSLNFCPQCHRMLYYKEE